MNETVSISDTAGFSPVGFSTARKGYDRSEVDAYLSSEAQIRAALEEQIVGYRQRLQQAESQPERVAGEPEVSTETITRTLVLAQQTADGVIAEAEQAAARLVAEARDAARATAEECDDYTSRLRAEAETDSHQIVSDAAEAAKAAATAERDGLSAEIARLAELRDMLQADVKLLEDHLSRQRSILLDAAGELTEFLERPAAFRVMPAPATSQAEAPEGLITRDDIEQAGTAQHEGEHVGTTGCGEDDLANPAADTDGAAVASAHTAEAREPALDQTTDAVPDKPTQEQASALLADDSLFAAGSLDSHEPRDDAEPPPAEPFPEMSRPKMSRPETGLPDPTAHELPVASEPEAIPRVVLSSHEMKGGVAADPDFDLQATAPFPVIEVREEAPAEQRRGSAESAAGDGPPPAADSFLEQLREAVSSPGSDPIDDPLKAFFEQDEDSRARSWFGRRR